MKSWRNTQFRKAFSALPRDVKRLARRAYRVFAKDPRHPSLCFKKVHASKPIYSVRIGLHYRALGVKAGDEIVWFWIGSHAEYDRLTR